MVIPYYTRVDNLEYQQQYDKYIEWSISICYDSIVNLESLITDLHMLTIFQICWVLKIGKGIPLLRLRIDTR